MKTLFASNKPLDGVGKWILIVLLSVMTSVAFVDDIDQDQTAQTEHSDFLSTVHYVGIKL